MARMGKPHIPNLYEDTTLTTDELTQAVKMLLGGEFRVREKLDGQNFTFTYREGKIRFLGKGIIQGLAGGLDRDGLRDRYKDRPVVLETFLGAYDALQSFVPKWPFRVLLEEGKYAFSAEVISRSNPNLVQYDQDAIVILDLVETDSGIIRAQHNGGRGGYADTFPKQSGSWTITQSRWLHAARPARWSDDKRLSDNVKMLEFRLKTLIRSHKTVESMHVELVEQSTKKMACIPIGRSKDAAHRLVTESAARLSSKQFHTAQSWREFQGIERDRVIYVGQGLMPLEQLFQDITDVVLDQYDFQFAPKIDPSKWREFAEHVRVSQALGSLKGSPSELSRVSGALQRLGDTSKLTRNLEGVVFGYAPDVKSWKLTGRFAALNRLHGHFQFGNVRF